MADSMGSARAGFPQSQEDFKDDVRVSFDRQSNTYVLEDDDGSEWEWNDKVEKWIPALDEADFERQQQIYRVEGVDDSEDAVNTAAEKNKKRKAELKAENEANKKAKNEPKERPNTAIYVNNIPLDADFDEIHDKFRKYGIIEEDIHTNLPKIKLYADEHGKFKGDARIIYFRPESVALAIRMLDGTDFYSTNDGAMSVQMAEFSANKQNEVSIDSIKKHRSKKDRAAAIKKTQEMNARLADWDSDDDVTPPPRVANKYNRMVVLKHMFTLAELEEDAANILDIKEDVREEAAKCGTVTNTILYDLEPSGVVTVRFTDPESAKRCAKFFNGRGFNDQTCVAYVPEHKEVFSKSSRSGSGDLLNDSGEDYAEELAAGELRAKAKAKAAASAVQGQDTVVARDTKDEKEASKID